MIRRFVLTLSVGLLIASCAPQPVPVPINIPSPTAAAPAHAPEIRFALIGEPQDINAWQLFDETGASYANYALRSEYWPRLYQLAPPEFNFQPFAANGMPSAIMQDGDKYSATVKLRSDLKWTDASPFTADDVVFTINTSLQYELGYDWETYYSKDYLDHVEPLDSLTVKFYFKKKPNIAVWQYGALQGPILQKAFWESRISAASALLPDEKLLADIESAKTYLATVQASVDKLSAQANQLLLNGKEDRQVTGELAKRQGELGYANNTLNKLLDERAVAIESAHQALYAVDDTNEPTLGTWIPTGEKNGVWTNEANSDFPFIQPHFDRATYKIFASQEEALKALQNDEVDLILSSKNKALPTVPSSTEAIMSSLNGEASFLVFNPEKAFTTDPAFHQAIACMLWTPAQSLSGPYSHFVLDGNKFWYNQNVLVPCGDLTDEDADLAKQRAIQILKSAGYSWEKEPTSVLKMPNGEPLPTIKLLSLFDDAVALDPLAANAIAQKLATFGISVVVENGTPQDMRYAVFSSKKYDMAILNWRLSEYPSYLCEWFGAGGQFENNSSRLKSACEALGVESDLEAAKDQIFEIQSILMEELPFIPLYAGVTYDAFQNIQYPFESVFGGLGTLYGAPSYAMPAK